MKRDETTILFGTRIARKRKAPKWAAPLLATMAAGHLALFIGMWAKSIWDVEQLEKPKNIIDLTTALPPPPPPPPPKGSNKPQDVQVTPKKPKVRELIQPVHIEDKTPSPETPGPGDPNGSPDGVPNGVSDGVVGTPPPPAPLPPPPPPVAAPKPVAPNMLEAMRIAGNKDISPDDTTKTEIKMSGKDRIVSAQRLCIDASGNVTSVSQARASGFSAYDAKIQREMRLWRYRPVTIDGKAVPVCTVVTFIYSQR